MSGFGGSLAAKCVSVNNQSCMVIPTLSDLNFDELLQRLHHYLLTVKLNRSGWSCNTFKNVSDKIYIANKKRYKYLIQ